MKHTWTFGQMISAGFAAVLALNLIVGGIALIGLRDVVAQKDRVINVDAQLVLDAQELLTIRTARAAANRAYLLSGQESYLTQQYAQDKLFDAQIAKIRGQLHTARGRELMDQVTAQEAQFRADDAKPVGLKQNGAPVQAVVAAWQDLAAGRTAIGATLRALIQHEQDLAAVAKGKATATARDSTRLIVAVLVLAMLAALAFAFVLTRRLRGRIGTAVGEVLSSSAELQTTANQQAVGAKEQATAMNEISSTVTELLATSQQIAESAQRVTGVADQTAAAGRSGVHTVTSARESMVEIRRQVDTIVDHMVQLGEKSQRIGAILEIVSELAEQTNILAINSTIEAAGAGESGKRFAVVADEIRKLADRVGESTKEIRDLIDVVRGAVNTTVMATEIGSKAVGAGAAHVEGVAASFEQIVALMSTTTQAAREIELSTKQQSTAVEQVNLAVSNVAQTTRETEANSGQTLQTASQLSVLSARLRSLVDTSVGA